MVHEPLDETLRPGFEVGALAVGAGALILLVLALAAELLRRHRRAPALLLALDRLLPRPARTVALALVTMAASVTAPATAGADGSVHDWLRGRQPTTTPTSTLVAPASTTTSTTTTTTTTTASTPAPSTAPPAYPAPPAPPAPPLPPPPMPVTPVEQHVVETGDCLWSIARHRLGAAATNTAVDAGWRAIYAANRAAVGDDPNLIHPGLVLTLPPITPPT